MRPGILVKSLVIILFVGIMAAADVRAGDDKKDERFIYQWTDKEGTVHITDSLEKVPNQYRNRAKKIEEGISAGSGETLPAQPEPAATGGNEPGREQDDEYQKAAWKQKMQDARRRLVLAEERYQQTEKSFNALQEKWGSGLYGYTPEVQDELDRLKEEMLSAQKDVNDAKNQVEVVLPDEARRAGIPPGWLRDIQ